MEDIYTKIEAARQSGIPSAFCIVIETNGSTPRKAGSKMIVFSDRRIQGTVGGGSLEMRVIADALEVIASGVPRLTHYDLVSDLDMECGGESSVYIEPLGVTSDLFIFGAGHIGRVLAKYAGDFGFRITLFDDRQGIFDGLELPGCRFVVDDYAKLTKEAAFTAGTYIVIMTHNHAFDEQILRDCMRKPHRYLGMIGSVRKTSLVKKKFQEEGVFSEAEIDSVDMPIGIPFAAETPAEIAISVLAKLIDVKNSNRVI